MAVMSRVFPPNVAGLFYPEETEVLRGTVQAFLDQAASAPPIADLRALVAPHAGYIYSGRTAARAYALLRPLAPQIETVVMLGPAHRAPVFGAVLPAAGAFATPLGEVPVNQELKLRLADAGLAAVQDRPFAGEHCLEVQLPFLQSVLGSFDLLPLLIGEAEPDEVSAVISRAADVGRVLIVVSTDLSHFLSDSEARRVDARTRALIEALDYENLRAEQACGAAALRGLLHYARRQGLRAVTLDMTNSSTASGDVERVVGYGAYAFFGGAGEHH